MAKPPLLDRLTTRRLMAVWALLFAVLTILPALSGPGLWEPQEMRVADAAAARVDADDEAEEEAEAKEACPKKGEPDGARTLNEQLAAQGLRHLGSDEGDLRLGGALLGVLCVLAAFGIGARLGGARAGLIGAVVLCSFPLLVLQSRQLTSEIGTAAGATLLTYALVALAWPTGHRRGVSDVIVALEVAALCAAIAFLGGGMFYGVLPPLAGVALAGGFGVVLFGAGARLARQLYYRAIGAVSPRRAVGRIEPLPVAARLSARDAWAAAIGLLAFLGALAAAYVIVDQIYDIQTRAPGTREVLGKSFVPTECWSGALGGVWKHHDDARSPFDSMFEQAGFGMFPWAILAPVALLGLALSSDERRRFAGRLTLGWAIVAWVTGTVFERKVGFAIYAGFPACAIAIGIWLDGFLAGRERARDERSALGLLIGLWVLLGMVTIAKDLQAFPDRITSLLVDKEAIKYPPTARFLELPLKSWLLVIGGITGLLFAAGAWLWRPKDAPRFAIGPVPPWGWAVLGVLELLVVLMTMRKFHWEPLHFPVLLAALAIPTIVLVTRPFALRFLGTWGVHLSLVVTFLTGVFWAQAWQPTLSKALSSKHVFAVYRALRKDGDKLAILGDMGNAPRYYAGGEPEKLSSKEQLITYLGAEERVFALAPKSDHCAIHRAFSGREYFVLDDTNAKFMLLSNSVEGGRDHNPLLRMIVRERPANIQHVLDPKKKLPTWDSKLELIGFDMPRSVPVRGKFQMTLYFHVLAPVSGSWKLFVHFDGRGQRFQGDHEPIDGRCATSFWQQGDYIVDTFTVEAGDITFEGGEYAAKIGFFTGTNPNWKNMKVSAAPANTADDADRVTIGSIRLE